MFAWILMTIWPKMAAFGEKGEGVVRCWPQRTCSYFWWLLHLSEVATIKSPLCHFWRKSIKNCDR